MKITFQLTLIGYDKDPVQMQGDETYITLQKTTELDFLLPQGVIVQFDETPNEIYEIGSEDSSDEFFEMHTGVFEVENFILNVDRNSARVILTETQKIVRKIPQLNNVVQQLTQLYGFKIQEY